MCLAFSVRDNKQHWQSRLYVDSRMPTVECQRQRRRWTKITSHSSSSSSIGGWMRRRRRQRLARSEVESVERWSRSACRSSTRSIEQRSLLSFSPLRTDPKASHIVTAVVQKLPAAVPWHTRKSISESLLAPFVFGPGRQSSSLSPASTARLHPPVARHHAAVDRPNDAPTPSTRLSADKLKVRRRLSSGARRTTLSN